MKFPPFLLSLTIACAAPASALAQDSALLRQETTQQSIQEATARASTQLNQLVGEFERNGITGQDVEILKGIQSVLGKLSSQQMAEIVQLLQDARSAAPGATSTTSGKIVTAYSGQKAIIVQLRQILLEYQRQLALDEIAQLIRELGDRQSSNLHEALSIISATSRPGASPNTSQKINVQLQASEQVSIRDEAGHLIERLTKLADRGADDRPGSAISFSTGRRLRETLADSASDLDSGRLMSAAGSEKTSRDTLWQLADLLQSDRDKTNLLIEAAAELDELIEAEKEIIAATEVLDQKPEIPGEENIFAERRVRQAQEQVERAKQRAVEAVERDRAQLERSEQQQRTELAKAEQEIVKAKNRADEKALRQREQALQRVRQNAERQIKSHQQRIAKQEETSRKSIANTENNLRRAIEDTRKKLELPSLDEAMQQAARDVQRDQGETVDKTDFLREQLAGVAADAASQLQQSVAEMQAARAALGSKQSLAGRKEAALPPEQSALAKLELARESILAELEELQIASEIEPDTEGLNKAEQLEDLLGIVQDLKAEQEELLEKSESATATAALTQQHAPQAALENQTRQAEQQAASVAPEAAADLNDAAGQMEAAVENLASEQSPSNEQQAAVDALTQAEEKIRSELDELAAAQAELAALDDLLEKLRPVIEKQQNLQTDTTQLGTGSETQAEALADEQADLQEQTTSLAEQASSQEVAVPEAAESLSDASAEQGEAAQQLANNQPQIAQAAQAEALADLNAAKDALEQRRDELAETLGEAGESPADFAAAQAAIAQAQEQVSEALEQLESPASAAQELAAAQRALAEAAAEASSNTSPQAQQATAAAAQELAQGDLPSAIAEMQTAQDSLPEGGDLASEQAAIQEAAEALAAAAEAAAAASPLAAASDAISPLSSGSQGALPPGAEAALGQAQQSLSQSTAEASANSAAPAQASAAAAQQALAEASAALTLAEAGLGAPAPPSAQASNQPGQQPGDQPGKGEQPGPPGKPGQEPAPSNGDEGNWEGKGGDGERKKITGSSRFIGLPERERGTLRQGTAASYPAEYSSMIEQYLKNLSDKSSGGD